MKLPPGIVFLAGLVLGACMAVVVLHSRGHEVPQAPVPPPVSAELQPVPWDEAKEERAILKRLVGEWASWDGRQTASFDGQILRFQAASGWPDLENKSFFLGLDRVILSESGFYMVQVLLSDMDTIRFIKKDLASGELTTLQLFRVGTPRARARPPLPDTPPPRVIQDFLDSMDQLNSGTDRQISADVPAKDLTLDVLVYDATSLGGDNVYMILRLGDGDEWMIEQDVFRGKITRQRMVRGSAELVRKGEGGISEYLYPYYADGKLITGVSATGLQQVKALGEGSGEH